MDGAYSPDGTQLAYVPIDQWQQAWKRYRGGQTTPIWIATLADSSVEKIPRNNSNDFNPMWVGDTVYFLSDRNGPVTLFAYDTKSKQVTEAVKNERPGLQVGFRGPGRHRLRAVRRAASLRPEDRARRKPVNVKLAGDLSGGPAAFSQTRAAMRSAHAAISPTGARAVFEAHGEILTVPAEKGDMRNLTNTPAVEERDPAWSPDGKSIAYFSDESGEYALQIRGQNGMGEVTQHRSGQSAVVSLRRAGRRTARKSPTPTRRLNLWYVDLEKGDAGAGGHGYLCRSRGARTRRGRRTASGSPIPSSCKSHLHAVFVYSLDQGKTTRSPTA